MRAGAQAHGRTGAGACKRVGALARGCAGRGCAGAQSLGRAGAQMAVNSKAFGLNDSGPWGRDYLLGAC